MTAIAIYLVKWALALTVLYPLFRLTLRGLTLHRFNRAVLVGTLITSMVMPLCRIEWRGGTWLGKQVSALEEVSHSGPGVTTRAVVVGRDEANRTENPSATESTQMIASTVSKVVVVASLLLLVQYMIAVARMRLLIRRSKPLSRQGNMNICLSDEIGRSCSWWHTIILARKDTGRGMDSILLHESAHIRLHHSIDKMLIELTCRALWFLPTAWMLRQDLLDIHEYEADSAVLSSGIDINEYNQLLIAKAVTAVGLQPVAHTFNQSQTKNRIRMMYKTKSSWLQSLRGLYLVPAAMIALSAFAYDGNAPHPTVITPQTQAKAAEPASDDEPVVTLPDVNPQFKGGDSGLMKWLSDNIQYPADCLSEGLQGRVIVQFIVEKDGKLTGIKALSSPDPRLSTEAIKCVKKMPAWIPGKKDGKTVRVQFFIPIIFKLS